MKRLVVIGGSDAAISAGLRAREVDTSVEVSLVVSDAFPNYSICGLPFFLSGEQPDWEKLAHRTIHELEGAGLRLLLEQTATSIDVSAETVTVEGAGGRSLPLPYDQLVIATGAIPIRPRIRGLDLPGVHVLHTMDDSFELNQKLVEADKGSAVVVGSGYIGLEMADALVHRGMRVSLIGRAATVLPTVDTTLGRLVSSELQRHGVDVVSGAAVEAIESRGSRLKVHGAGGVCREGDLVLVAAGVQPNSDLAAAAGIRTGPNNAIRVDRSMATNIPSVYAAGDCTETWHRVLGRNTYLPLGTTAHKQGRVAGENAVGGDKVFGGSLGTQVVKVFDLVIARTGLRDDEARSAGFDPLTVESEVWDHKAYYPGARQLRILVTGDRRTGRLLGAQILGPWGAEVAKRIDVYAAAIYHEMTVDAVSDLDLSYTPPISSPWDPVQMSAQLWDAAHRQAS